MCSHTSCILSEVIIISTLYSSCRSILARLWQVDYAQAIQLGAMAFGSYLTALWTSMLIYRFFFHRLHAIPGPRLAKLSEFYQFSRGLKLKAFRRLHEAHRKYGNFVRTGELMINPRPQFIRRCSSEAWISRLSCDFLSINKSKQVPLMDRYVSLLLSTLRWRTAVTKYHCSSKTECANVKLPIYVTVYKDLCCLDWSYVLEYRLSGNNNVI